MDVRHINAPPGQIDCLSINKTSNIKFDKNLNCVVPENIHIPPHPPPLSMEGYWKFQGVGRSRGKKFRGVCWVRRVIYLLRVQEHCLREIYQYRIYDLINQQVDEL